jgi:hypothetical protein
VKKEVREFLEQGGRGVFFAQSSFVILSIVPTPLKSRI